MSTAAQIAAVRAIQNRNRDFIRAEKEKPCADCLESFPYYVMDFDHRPGTDKQYLPSRMWTDASLKRIKEEIAKCDVVCANCHRMRTHERANCLKTASPTTVH